MAWLFLLLGTIIVVSIHTPMAGMDGPYIRSQGKEEGGIVVMVVMKKGGRSKDQ